MAPGYADGLTALSGNVSSNCPAVIGFAPCPMWLNFAGTPAEPYADILAIEACSSLANLLDKRSRFAPSTHSLMAVCPLPWLLAPVTPDSTLLRWQATGVITSTPATPLILPVRDLRVMYGLNPRHYQRFVDHQLPHPHEFFVPMDALTAKNGDKDPAMQALVARTSVRANFFAPILAPILAPLHDSPILVA
jgi:hypothetical protein